jgi:surface antigen
VKAGDTAASIAAKFQAVEAQVSEFNDLDIKPLAAGQQIIVPEGRIQEVPKPAAVAAKPSVNANAQASYMYGSGNGAGYPWGQCTYGVAEMIPGLGGLGNAGQWGWNLRARGWTINRTPQPGDIAWTNYGYWGYGHVAFVLSVNANGTATIRERNFLGNPYPTTRTVSFSEFQGYLRP